VPGLECLSDNITRPRHRHFRAYATVVVSGTFEESSYAGRIRATAGDVLIAERDVHEASALLVEILDGGPPGCPGEQNDWPDCLAGDLGRNPSMSLGTWADGHGLARETVSRGFSKAYGIAPEVFRAELRTKAAWFRITRESERLGLIATETGFADQAHMSRWVHRLTGLSPLAWRRRPLLQ
jgi:AraC-like DNA-binding protein